MARYRARVVNRQGSVFDNLPILSAQTHVALLAADGVSCSICHQIQKDKLGTHESFTAGFVIDAATSLGERLVFGPYEVDRGRTRVGRNGAVWREVWR